MKKRRKFLVLAVFVSVVMLGVSSFAATKSWGATLGRRRGPTYLQTGTYNNTSSAVEARVSYMGGNYNRMYFYLKTSQGEGSSTKGTLNAGYVAIPNAPGMNNPIQVELRGGNDKWSIVHVDASGYVKFP